MIYAVYRYWRCYRWQVITANGEIRWYRWKIRVRAYV